MASTKPRGHKESSKAHKGTARYKREQRVFGAKVRAMRHAAEWTLEEAADRCDLDWKHLQKVEAGSLNFTFVTLVRLAVGFEKPLHAFFVPVDSSEPATVAFVKRPTSQKRPPSRRTD